MREQLFIVEVWLDLELVLCWINLFRAYKKIKIKNVTDEVARSQNIDPTNEGSKATRRGDTIQGSKPKR